MQQSTRRLVILVGSTLLSAGGLLLAACSSDSTSGSSGDLPTVEAGKKDGTTSSSSGGPDADTDAASSADCGSAPKLRDNTNGYYCAFVPKDAGVDAADGGNPSYCHNNETCCSPGKDTGGGFGTTACVYDPTKTGNTACAAADPTWAARTGNTIWECADKNNCPAGESCWMGTALDAGGTVNVGKSTDKTIPAACNALQAYKENGTHCAVTGAAGEIKLCSSSDDNCGAGTTCTPFAGLFRDLGYCK